MIQFDTTFQTLLEFYMGPSMRGILLVGGIVILLAMCVKYIPQGRVAMMIEYAYEKAFGFYREILGEGASTSSIAYITILFFVILVTNITGVCLDFIAPIFGKTADGGGFIFSSLISVPSVDLHFNMALAIVSILLLIMLQIHTLGGKKFFLSYIPLTGKDYLTMQKPSQTSYIYIILFPLVKLGDIMISLFLSFLDIIGLFAKIISLSFRLFGNMVSGGILLGMLVIGMGNLTETYSEFLGGINFPVVFPLVLYSQGLLVAGIQAMVFPLLVAIFIRVSQLEG